MPPSEDESCETCHFWKQNPQAHNPRSVPHGRCRIRPPIVVVIADRAATRWPETASNAWCVEWKDGEPIKHIGEVLAV